MTGAKQRRSLEEAIVDTVREPLIVLDEAMCVLIASRSFYRLFQVTKQEAEGRSLFELGNGQWNIASLRERLGKIIPDHATIEGSRSNTTSRRSGSARCC
jgi:two-component system CheB/CheR fusion protein